MSNISFDVGISQVSRVGPTEEGQLPKTTLFRPSEQKVENHLLRVLQRIPNFQQRTLDDLLPNISDTSVLAPPAYNRALEEVTGLLDEPEVQEALKESEDGDDWLVQEMKDLMHEEHSMRDLLLTYQNMLRPA